ncbi:rab11 family-interacting protein 1 isoform X2 [Melopsittacus undulatus]|uniref:rab11 family-interacting protein 1 isoform X2 n=1 Tax=Melopsittacus undulatus TaxID=13146 RepID=UPI00146C2C04|nr:rab11 family-interacting protein 1 isoform X2 [Melopsittacus undulatus]
MSGSGLAAGWVPTHVQVTVLRARGLRPKAAAVGGSDAYAVMALGRDKFSTSVAERCQGQPVWREEATFELPPRSAALRLTVLHRALVGIDKFLGRAEVDLAALRSEGGRRHTRWYKLRSKPGKKEKERGEIEVDIQFMRSNMTASMFDLSMKDKPRSPFGKLKDKLKGKRSSGLSDTASSIIPSTSHSPVDSEDEAVEKEKKKSKFKALFSKPGLQKTSLSQSMSVLPTQQPLTQRVLLRPSDFQAQWEDEESETSPASEKSFGNALEEKSSPSPLFKSRKTAILDSRQVAQVTTTHPKKEGLSLFSGLKSKSDPVSKSSLCINGSHVYMEESSRKDNTPASSPSPRNFRRKQLFASEENLSSRAVKGPEEMGRTSPMGSTSPSHAFSGSASLETFKSMTLPSYKLLSSEEYLETDVPPSVEVGKESRKPEHKKSALLSLVAGKKEAGKGWDAEGIPDRSLQDEANSIPEEESEQEARCVEPPADAGRGDAAGAGHHMEDIHTSKQPLNPFEEERAPEKAAAPSKTKAVKPRVPSEEETKATLPTLAPPSLPAFLSVHPSRSANNPFVSIKGPKGQVPDSEGITASPASFTAPPSAAELLNGKNPFTPEWGRASPALDAEGIRFPSSHHLPTSVPTPPPRQVSGRGNNPFASEWAQSSWGQGAEGSGVCPSHPPASSLPSACHFNGSNPFVSQLGWEADAPSSEAVACSSPLCLRCNEGCSSAQHPAELKPSALRAAGCSSAEALPAAVKAGSNPLSTVKPALAPAEHCSPPQLQAPIPNRETTETGAEQAPSPMRELKEKQETLGEKRWELPQMTPLDQTGSFPQAGPTKPSSGACPPSPHAGREVLVTPKPAPRLSLGLKAAHDGDVPPLGDGAKSVLGLPLPNDEGSDAHGCLPRSGSLEPVTPPGTPRAESRNRHLYNEADHDVFDSLANLKCVIPVPGDRGLKLASLPVIPEGGSDEELLGDSQEDLGLAAGGKNVSERGKQCLYLMSLHEEWIEHSDSDADACEPSTAAMLPARVAVHSASGLGGTSHSREDNAPLEKQELKISAGAAGGDFSEPSLSSSSLSGASQPSSSSHSLLSDIPNPRAESPIKPPAEGSAAKAGMCGKKKLLQAWVSPSEPSPYQTQQGGETGSPKHRLHPVKPMNATANKFQSKALNVISTMNEKLLESNVKYHPSDPAYAYAQLTHDELIQLVLKQKDAITRKDLQVRELEDYIDNLLVRVMEETPNILRVATSGTKKAGKM